MADADEKTVKKAAEAPAEKDAEAASDKAAEAASKEGAGKASGKAAGNAADKIKDSLLSTKKGAKIPDEAVELHVDEDRTRLLVYGLGFLVLNIALLLLVVVFWGVANLTGNVVYLILIIAALTVVWFVSKRMGRFLGKFFKKVGLVDFLEKHVVIYPTSDASDVIVVTYKQIKNYRVIRQGKALRLLMSGDWVKHPSGYQLVDINRPFAALTLDELERQIKALMKAHRVNERK